MQMLFVRLVSVVVTLGGVLFISQRTAADFFAVPSAYELRGIAERFQTEAFPRIRQRLTDAKTDVIVPGNPVSQQTGDTVLKGPEFQEVPVRLVDSKESLENSVAIPFLSEGGTRAKPQAGQVESAIFRGGQQSIDIIAVDDGTLSELPTISIPQERVGPDPDIPVVPELRPVSQPHTDQVFTPLRGVQTFLLMGSDKRDGDATWRTDVVIIAVLDQKRNRVDMISVPRDLYIEDPPRQDSNKINTFDYWGEQERPGGGPELMKQIVLSYFGIPIDHFVRLQFSGFSQIVDAMGGIDVYVPCPLYDIRPEENLYLNLQPGHHTLDGEQALAYVRSREQGGDLSRVERQQQVLIALKQKFTVRNMVSQIPSIYTTVRKAVDTDIGIFDAVALARLAYSMNFENISVLTLRPHEHFEGGWAQGMQVWLPDWERIRNDVQLLLASVPDSPDAKIGTSAAEIEEQSLVAARCQ